MRNYLIISFAFTAIIVLVLGFLLSSTSDPHLGDPASFSNAAWQHYRNDNYREAVTLFHDLLEEEETYQAYVGLGWSYFRMKDYPAAIQSFTQAQQLDANRYGSHDGLGRSHMMQREYRTAVQHFDRGLQVGAPSFNFLETGPQNEMIIAFYSGWSYLQLKSYDLAEERFQQALHAYPVSLMPHLGLFLTYHESGDTALAMQRARDIEQFISFVGDPAEEPEDFDLVHKFVIDCMQETAFLPQPLARCISLGITV